MASIAARGVFTGWTGEGGSYGVISEEVVDVAVGGSLSYALKSDGTVHQITDNGMQDTGSDGIVSLASSELCCWLSEPDSTTGFTASQRAVMGVHSNRRANFLT